MTSTSTSKQIGKVALTPAGSWDNTNEYEKLDVVYYQGGSYVAKKAVPVATNITNEEYWQTLAKKAPNLTIGTVTTVSASTNASASIGGTADAPTLNLSIPRGVTGNESINDTKGNGDTDYVWSADQDVRASDIISTNLMGINVQENLYEGAADWSGTWNTSDSVNMEISQVLFSGYRAVYSKQSWRRWGKNIPVVAGKTYTFECWFKHATAGAAYIYITHKDITTDSATVSPNSQQFNNIPANTWVKLSLTFTCTVSGNVSVQ